MQTRSGDPKKNVLDNPQYADELRSHLTQQTNIVERHGHQAEQLPMFMSAREVMHQYQPLDADRQDFYDPREGEPTARSETTGGKPNARLSTYDKKEGFAKHAAQTGDTHYRQYGHSETDEQLWSRKLNESQMPYSEYAEHHGGGMAEERTPGWNSLVNRSSAPKMPDWDKAGTGTWEEAEQNQASYVQRKQEEHHEGREFGSLHETLSEAMQPGGVGFTGHVHLGSQFGESGKRQIVGAHHRIAAMEDIDPERMLPVVHHKSIYEARGGFAGLPYT